VRSAAAGVAWRPSQDGASLHGGVLEATDSRPCRIIVRARIAAATTGPRCIWAVKRARRGLGAGWRWALRRRRESSRPPLLPSQDTPRSCFCLSGPLSPPCTFQQAGLAGPFRVLNSRLGLVYRSHGNGAEARFR